MGIGWIGLFVAVAWASAAAAEKRMVCYYGAWAVYRPGRGKFVVEDIDPNICTHLVYGFAKLENNEIKSYDPWEDLQDNYGKGGFLRFTGLKKKNPKLKTLLAIGGWNEGSANYSMMASSPMTRKIFVNSVVPFLKKYNFDGLDLDWEYPTTRGGKPEDKENFSHLVRELRRALKGYLLTAAVSPNIETVEQGYDVPVLSEHLDMVSIMGYDYHGAWEGHPYTGHNTPLYRHPKDENYIPHFNVNDSLTFWINAGLAREKINLGMALYGRGFVLDDPAKNGLYAPAENGIKMGPYTRQDGTWGYNEICEVFKAEAEDWRIVIDPYVQAPYAYKGSDWIGYDDVESLYVKAKYGREMGVGGAMVWSLETDDFKGYCHNQKYILIKTIRKTMDGGGQPKIPTRPQVVDGVEENEIQTIQTPEPDYELETTTRRKPRPGTKRTTTPTPAEEEVDYEEEVTTKHPTRRPSATKRPTRRPTTPTPSSPEDVDYESDFETTTRRRPQNARVTTNSPSGVAPGECVTDGIIPNPSDCESFIICQNLGGGVYRPHVQSCAHGLVFDPQISGCNFPSAVSGGCGGNKKISFYRKHSQ